MSIAAPAPTFLFQHLRLRLLHNALFRLIAHAWLRLFTVLLCSAFIWVLLFAVTWQGFFELKVRWNINLDVGIIELIFDVLFLSLTVLLIFSTGIILYSSLFASAESTY